MSCKSESQVSRWQDSQIVGKLAHVLNLLHCLEIALNQDLANNASEPSQEVKDIAQNLSDYFERNRLYLYVGTNGSALANTFGVLQYVDCLCKYVPVHELDCSIVADVNSSIVFYNYLKQQGYHYGSPLTITQHIDLLCCLKDHYSELKTSYVAFL